MYNSWFFYSYIVRIGVGVPHTSPVKAAVAAASAVGVSDAVVEDEPHDRVLGGEAARAIVALVVAEPEHVFLDVPVRVDSLDISSMRTCYLS